MSLVQKESMRQRGPRYLATLAMLIMALCGCRETMEAHYPTLAAAEQAGAISRGWIPRWTPASAKDIAEVHNLDTNARLLAYSFESRSASDFQKPCSPVEQRNVALPRWVPVKWWPETLRWGTTARGRFKFFVCDDSNGPRSFVAVDESGARVFIWGTPGLTRR